MVIVAEFILKVVSLILLAVSLCCASRVVSNVAKNIAGFGDAKGRDHAGREFSVKQIEMTRAQNSFWITVAIVVVVVVGIMDKISQDLFVGLLIAGLGSLGIKVAADARSTKNIGELKEKDNTNKSAV